MKVLLTGAAGFIGSHLARRMLEDGCEVHALLRRGGDRRRIADILSRLTAVEGDLFSDADIDRAVDAVRPDLCIHLAWCTAPGSYWTSLENLSFLAASLRLAKRLAETGCRRFLGAGTCAEYEPSAGPLRETAPTASTSLYVAAKLGLFMALEQLGKATGMEVAWARIFFLYGPFEDERRLVPMVIRSLLRDREVQLTSGEQARDFLHVEDVAAALWAVAGSRLLGPVNIGSGQPVAVRDVAAAIGELLDRPRLLKFGSLPSDSAQPMSIDSDNSLLRGKTPWTPRFGLKEGLLNAIEWWRAHRE
jgi:nucleoside-diphosphate-sugar epimerase